MHLHIKILLMGSEYYQFDRNTISKFTLFIIAVGGLILYNFHPATAINLATGFTNIHKSSGIEVYRKKITDNKLDFVTIVNTKRAKIDNLTGSLSVSDRNKIHKQLLTQFWQDGTKRNSSIQHLKVVVNGTFFSTNDEPTGIAFGLKLPGESPIYGYGVGKEYFGQIRTLSWNHHNAVAKIKTYMMQTFKNSQNVVGGLDITANKSAQKYLPRTFVGISDRNQDGLTETVMFYSSNYARQVDAYTTLKKFGAKNAMMLDGGGSTGLIVDGKPLIPTNRPLPHAFAIYQLDN